MLTAIVVLAFLPGCATARGESGALRDLTAGERPVLDSDEAGLWMAMDRVEIVSQRYESASLRDVFGYEPAWPVISAERRAETDALIGAPAPRPAAGPEAGEHAGIPGAGEPGRPHVDARSAGGDTREGG